MILLQEGNSAPCRNDDDARRRLQLTVENLEERRLAGPVRTDQTIAVAFRKFDIDILKESLFADSVCYVCRFNHGFYKLLVSSFLGFTVGILPGLRYNYDQK
jgi:hypothetical protein